MSELLPAPINIVDRDDAIVYQYIIKNVSQVQLAEDYGIDQSAVSKIVAKGTNTSRALKKHVQRAKAKIDLFAPQAVDNVIGIASSVDPRSVGSRLKANEIILRGSGVILNLEGEKAPITVNIGQIQALIGQSLGYEVLDTAAKQANGRSLQGDDKGDVIDIDEE